MKRCKHYIVYTSSLYTYFRGLHLSLHFLLRYTTFTHTFRSARGRSGTPISPASRSGSRLSLTGGRPSSRSLSLYTPKEEEEDEDEESKEDDTEDPFGEEEERDHSIRTRTFSG